MHAKSDAPNDSKHASARLLQNPSKTSNVAALPSLVSSRLNLGSKAPQDNLRSSKVNLKDGNLKSSTPDLKNGSSKLNQSVANLNLRRSKDMLNVSNQSLKAASRQSLKINSSKKSINLGFELTTEKSSTKSGFKNSAPKLHMASSQSLGTLATPAQRLKSIDAINKCNACIIYSSYKGSSYSKSVDY